MGVVMPNRTTKTPPVGKAGGHHADIARCLEDFRAYIRAEHGLVLVGELRADGNFHGIGTEDDRRGAKPFRYCVHLDAPQNIYFTDLKRGIHGLWFPEGQGPLSPAERDRLRREAEVRRVQRDREARRFHENAAKRAAAIWRRSLPAPHDHAYLRHKGVGVYGVRFLPVWEKRVEVDGKPGQFETIRIPGVLLVPLRDETGRVLNLQAIFPEVCPALGRDKDFLPRARKKGLFHWIGRRTPTVCMTEGYATGATVHEMTGYRVIVCFDAGNLVDVAPIVRAMLPEARIVVCADHDPPDRHGRRAGLEFATEAAELVGGFVAVPPIEGQDFNDYWLSLKLKGEAHG